MYIKGLDLSAAWEMSMRIGYGVNVVSWKVQLVHFFPGGPVAGIPRKGLECIIFPENDVYDALLLAL
jgi:hypothetical protein